MSFVPARSTWTYAPTKPFAVLWEQTPNPIARWCIWWYTEVPGISVSESVGVQADFYFVQVGDLYVPSKKSVNRGSNGPPRSLRAGG